MEGEWLLWYILEHFITPTVAILNPPLNGQAATLAKDLQCFCTKETFSKRTTKVETKSSAEKRGIFDDTSNDFFLHITLEMEVSPRYK